MHVSRPTRLRLAADPELITHRAFGVPRPEVTPELMEQIEKVRINPNGDLPEPLPVQEAAMAIDRFEGGHTPTETQPRGFAIDPSGRYLLAVGQLSHAMSAYRIGDDGGLTKLAGYPMGRSPNWVEIVPLP